MTGNKLSNTQLEILKAFSHPLDEEDLVKLRKTLADFFSQRLIKEADKAWEDNKWSDEKMDDLLQTKKDRLKLWKR